MLFTRPPVTTPAVAVTAQERWCDHMGSRALNIALSQDFNEIQAETDIDSAGQDANNFALIEAYKRISASVYSNPSVTADEADHVYYDECMSIAGQDYDKMGWVNLKAKAGSATGEPQEIVVAVAASRAAELEAAKQEKIRNPGKNAIDNAICTISSQFWIITTGKDAEWRSLRDAGENAAAHDLTACVPNLGDKVIITDQSNFGLLSTVRVITGDQTGCVGDIEAKHLDCPEVK
jgi:hypothetical protein